MKKLFLGLLAIAWIIPLQSQTVKTEKLSEVTVYAVNYKYLKSIKSKEVASVPVELLERKVAAFDLKNSEFYQDDYDLYHINFYIPDGMILAAYGQNGEIIRTVEKFKNINLPTTVKEAVLNRFPGWEITKDIYYVTYHQDKGVNRKYKLKLENGDKVIRVKMDEKGNFL